MRGPNGRVVAQTVAPLRPDMKVLYMSGYTDDAIVNEGVLGGDTPFLPKPFTRDSLLRKVRDVLDG
jgi:ActR/RegA family two-component response regulator